jgi:ferrochelatase
MTTGVLVMAYGTPQGPDDIAAFYTDIRRGHPPSPRQLDDLKRRYNAIGGTSPLAQRTASQLGALRVALDVLSPEEFVVYYGAKHSHPRIEDAVRTMSSDGVSRMVGLVLAPHYSALSVGEYIQRARAKASEVALPSGFVERWGDDPLLIGLLSDRVEKAVSSLGSSAQDHLEVIFTAHSLPARIKDLGDPYEDELRQTADLVARRTGLSHYRIGWQSAGKTTDPWLGPDILELIPSLVDEGAKAVVVCAAGFTSDHLEVLYDLDIEAKGLATSLGVAFARTESLNDDPMLARLLARRVADARDTIIDAKPA